MRYLVDGYNLIFALSEEGSTLQNSREKIIELLKEHSSYLELSLIFDANDWSRSHIEDLEIVYTSPGETADAYIISEVRREKHPATITVVTSDRKLGLEVRDLGALVKEVKPFLKWLEKKQIDGVSENEKKQLYSPREMKRWLTIFEQELESE